jgi:hypothetical protein
MTEQEEVKVITLDDIDRIDVCLRNIINYTADALKTVYEGKDLEKYGKMSTEGYHIKTELQYQVDDIRTLLSKYAEGQVFPYHVRDMHTAINIRDMKDKVKVVDCT